MPDESSVEESYQYEPVVVRCPFCQATSSGELDATVALLAACVHCSQDIEEDGEHTGYGAAILGLLASRFGREETNAALKQVSTTQK